jgi:hypothetical protein
MLHTATALDDLIDEQFGPRLEAEGFHRVRSRRWVRAAKAPIREVVHVGSAKHGAHSSRWGLSFDFVPHELALHPEWHKTNATALRDLRIDPIDWSDESLAKVYRFAGDDPSTRSVASAAKATVESANQWFDRVSDVASTLPLFEEARNDSESRFGFDHYPQQRLAHAFVLAHTGQTSRGFAELAIWLDTLTRTLPTASKVEFHDLLAAI